MIGELIESQWLLQRTFEQKNDYLTKLPTERPKIDYLDRVHGLPDIPPLFAARKMHGIEYAGEKGKISKDSSISPASLLQTGTYAALPLAPGYSSPSLSRQYRGVLPQSLYNSSEAAKISRYQQ